MPIIEEVLDRRVHVITGSNTGIGFATAARLCAAAAQAKQSAVVVLACRNAKKANAARLDLLSKLGPAEKDFVEVEVLECDLADSKAVLESAKVFRKRYNRLDSLIFNAGMIPVESVNIFKAAIALLKDPANIAKTTGEVMVQSIGSTTKDEFQFGEAFAANFLGHYLLLKELEGVLEKTTKLLKDENRGWEGARVIWLTSDTAEHHMFDPNDIMCLKGAYPYESSKRLIELIHLETAARLREKGIYSVVANPGISATDVMKGTVPTWLILVALYFFRFCFLPAVCITPFNASRSEAYLAIEVTDPNELNPKTVYQSDVTFWGTSRVRKLVLSREGVIDCSGDVCTNGNVDLTKIREEVDAIYNRVKKASA